MKSLKQQARIRELHKEGYSQKEIARRLGIAQSTVWYNLNEGNKRKRLKNIKEWQRINRKRMYEQNKKWRRKNKGKYNRSIVLSIIRWGLRKEYITKEDLMRFK